MPTDMKLGVRTTGSTLGDLLRLGALDMLRVQCILGEEHNV
ncbi:hypothetical protein PIGHUM_03638 [Pigmentiphaga humi]|uniref:Uncharacterized protein n=1 Tax=Pigmentiphaga humi TaxID=2478468 RepID=A0A3P4B5H8_9BURK|nr:hypothetical protein PIGHUM_03638 [Pigmentiphaga humi]